MLSRNEKKKNKEVITMKMMEDHKYYIGKHKTFNKYIIEPSGDTTRPGDRDYFKELIFHLNNNKKICICAENTEIDGYCDIWMESDNFREVFNGEPHKAWWND